VVRRVIGRILAYIALYTSMGIMLSIYRPDVVTAVAMVVGATATYFAAVYGKRFERHVASAYASLMWSSGLFILFFLTYFAIESGQSVWGPALYAVYMVLGVSAVAIIGAKDYAAVMQNTSIRYVLMGIGLGLVVAWFAYAVPLQVAPLIGPTTQVLSVGDFATGVFITMLYIVAIPEEFSRVFAFHAGATTVDLFSASVAATVLGYALHAITRYPNTAVLAVVTLVWSLITAYYALTRCLFGSVMMHAVYNTMIVMSELFGALPVFIPSLIAAIVIFGYLAKEVFK